jgi:hypothetical protein
MSLADLDFVAAMLADAEEHVLMWRLVGLQ